MIILKIYQETFEIPTIHKVDRFPVVLGRSLKNQITIDHPEVSKEHLIIRRKGSGFLVEDLGSTNGFQVNGKSHRRLEVQHNTDILIAGVRIEFLIEEEELEKTVEIHLKEDRFRKLGIPLLCYTGILMLLLGLEPSFHAIKEKEIWDFLFGAILVSVFCFSSAGLIALLNKIHSSHYRLTRVMHIVYRSAIALALANLLDEFLLFHLSYRWMQAGIFVSFWSALLFYFFFKSILIFYPDQKRSKLMLYSGMIVLSLSISVVLAHKFAHRKDAQYRYFGLISYPVWEGRSYQSGMALLNSDIDASAKLIDHYQIKSVELEKKSGE